MVVWMKVYWCLTSAPFKPFKHTRGVKTHIVLSRPFAWRRYKSCYSRPTSKLTKVHQRQLICSDLPSWESNPGSLGQKTSALVNRPKEDFLIRSITLTHLYFVTVSMNHQLIPFNLVGENCPFEYESLVIESTDYSLGSEWYIFGSVHYTSKRSSFYELTAHNWQKWKRVFLTYPCHKIYRVEAVGLKSSNYTWKIMIFAKMWNLGQFLEKLIFCQQLLNQSSNLKILLHIRDTYNCDYLPHTIFRLCLIDFQLNKDFPSEFCVFYRKIT